MILARWVTDESLPEDVVYCLTVCDCMLYVYGGAAAAVDKVKHTAAQAAARGDHTTAKLLNARFQKLMQQHAHALGQYSLYRS
jgi:hypothetical protein